MPSADPGHSLVTPPRRHPDPRGGSPTGAASPSNASVFSRPGALHPDGQSADPSPFQDPIPVVSTGADLREALAGIIPGFVPTMGALHAGHAALIARSAVENPATVVSIFVNPTQFDDPEDYERYPRSLDRDADYAAAHGATLVFAPSSEEIYPPGFATTVEVAGLTERWESSARPGHFTGVATVVARLLGLVRPGRSYFGEKDFQQLQVVRRLHADLALPGAVVGCRTVREPDGLAFSSRNVRLSPIARRTATALPRALDTMVRLARGEDSVAPIVAAGEAVLRKEPGVWLDYLAVVDPATLKPLSQVRPGARAIVAAEVGGVRLVDNRELVPEATPWGS